MSLKAWRSKGPSFSKIAKSTDYDYKLKMAEKYYLNKDYNHAQQLYDDLYRVMKGSEHFEDIWYKYAYSAYYLRDYINAENLFKGFVEAFPNSAKSDEMDFMRAFTFYKQSPKFQLDQTNTTKAIGFLQAFVAQHPQSEKIKEADSLIAVCRAKLEQRTLKMPGFIIICGLPTRLTLRRHRSLSITCWLPIPIPVLRTNTSFT